MDEDKEFYEKNSFAITLDLLNVIRQHVNNFSEDGKDFAKGIATVNLALANVIAINIIGMKKCMDIERSKCETLVDLLAKCIKEMVEKEKVQGISSKEKPESKSDIKFKDFNPKNVLDAFNNM